MTISTQQLLAYADGELGPAEARAVEQALAADPLLAARLEAEQRLRATLKGHLDPVAHEPVPDALSAMIAAAMAEDAAVPESQDEPAANTANVASTRASKPAPVLDFAAAKARREEERKERARAKAKSAFKLGRPGANGLNGKAPVRGGPIFARPGLAAGLAASLVLGLMIGTSLDLGRFAAPDADVVEQDGRLLASGDLAKGLQTQLASNQGEDAALRILTSFRNEAGQFCRVYSDSASAGIACNASGDWVLERTMAQVPTHGASPAYRQAGSAEAELMQTAQGMAQGDALDAEAERKALSEGWRAPEN